MPIALPMRMARWPPLRVFYPARSGPLGRPSAARHRQLKCVHPDQNHQTQCLQRERESEKNLEVHTEKCNMLIQKMQTTSSKLKAEMHQVEKAVEPGAGAGGSVRTGRARKRSN